MKVTLSKIELIALRAALVEFMKLIDELQDCGIIGSTHHNSSKGEIEKLISQVDGYMKREYPPTPSE